MGATGHTCAFFVTTIPPTAHTSYMYLLATALGASGPLSALALFGRATTVIVIATL